VKRKQDSLARLRVSARVAVAFAAASTLFAALACMVRVGREYSQIATYVANCSSVQVATHLMQSANNLVNLTAMAVLFTAMFAFFLSELIYLLTED